MEQEWIGKAGEEGNPVWPLDSVQMLSLGGLLSPEASGTPGGGGLWSVTSVLVYLQQWMD